MARCCSWPLSDGQLTSIERATAMSDSPRKFTRLSFVKTFLLPALVSFLVPACALLFFVHAQSRFNTQAREDVLGQIRSDASLSPEDRENAIAYFNEHPFSELVKNENFAAGIDSEARFHYATFRWMIRLSALSIALGLAVFALVGLCVLFSLRSQQAQYVSLSIGWHALRIYGALQAVLQGILLVALSFWVTALWFELYSPKLVIFAAIAAALGVAVVVKAIFKRIDPTFSVEGTVIDGEANRPLKDALVAICQKVGTVPPDQVIVGIDDNFFVTEMPVTVNGETYHGRTLYVSLSLLKQMSGSEADAVLAHEMAHFSGNDTVYSKKISPLLVRYGHYLEALYQGGITRPIFYFMNCFRALYELSLGRLSRQREFRADRIAAEVTSPRDFAGAMLRIAAYSKFRGEVQQNLFKQEQVLATANISEQIEQGFQQFAVNFAAKHDFRELETSHPFDSHPPTLERLAAIGTPYAPQTFDAMLAVPGDGRWYARIEHAEQLEAQMWSEFEERFRSFHEQTLAYRFLPETDQEREIVVKAFPEVAILGTEGSLVVDHGGLNYPGWASRIDFGEITRFHIDDNKVLSIHFERNGKQKEKLKMRTFGHRQQDALDAINLYFGRYSSAVAYQEQKKQREACAGVA
jgi:Zn-dependent protease with chaperone function